MVPFDLISTSTVWEVPKYGVISGPSAGKYRPEKTPYLDIFHAAAIFTSGVLFIVTIPKFSIELENGPIKQVQNVAEKIKEEFVKLPSQHFLV